MKIKDEYSHKAFMQSSREHILMLTIHGVHQWQVIPSLNDTGGQNVFVNQFTDELVQQGYKVTIANRGGYPHPVTGEKQADVIYKNPYQRIIYLEDGDPFFVRKEEMDGQVVRLKKYLQDFLQEEGQQIDLLISHYWDAAVIGQLLLQEQSKQVQHIWIPHSLGEIKKRNVDQDQLKPLRIDIRIQHERDILSCIDYVASTSPIISRSLVRDYNYHSQPLWLPPCVSHDRYYPRSVPADANVWSALSQVSGLPIREVQRREIITEISRTDTTKRKDILLKAFAKVLKNHPDIFLALTIEENKDPVGIELMQLINTLGIRNHVAVLGSVWDLLPDIYAISHIYCTPSIMEGFGMSAQEAAATGVPVVSSSLVPFATHFLFGDQEHKPSTGGLRSLDVGQGAIIVEPDNIEGFSEALDLLLTDEQLHASMGRRAIELTIPRFTWPRVVENFIADLRAAQ